MKSSKSSPKHVIMIFAFVLIIMMVTSDQSSAIFAYVDSPVDNDSNIDSNSNIGTSGNPLITIEQSVSGGIALSNSITSPSITGVTGQLYIAVLSSKSHVNTNGVSGLGLTWTEIADQCGGRNQDGVSIWWAQGSASTGTVTATADASPSNTVIQVHRMSNVASTNPIGAVASSNTNGVSGGCSGGSDNQNPNVDISPTENQALVFGAVAVRSRVLTPGAGFTKLTENYFGTGGEMAGVATEYKITSPAQLTTVDGTLDAISDWALIALEIKPAQSIAYGDAQALDATNQDIQEVNSSTGTLIQHSIDNDVSDEDSSADFGSLSNFANTQSKDSTYATFSEGLGSDYSADSDGSTYFLVGDGSIDFGSTSGTIEMWMKFDVLAGRLWGQAGDFEVRSNSGAFTFDFGGTGTLTGQKSNWALNKWYFFAFTWDETDDDLYLYWGDESTLPTIDSSNTAWTTTVSTVGVVENRVGNGADLNEPIDGHLDEFRYWDTERTITEIQNDYDTVLTGSETNLQHYYQFENSLSDLAGSADLTVVGTGWSYSGDTSSAITDGYWMDQEVQFTNLIDFIEIEEVAIYTGTMASENIALSYWNSGWVSLASDLDTNAWNNFTVPLSASTLTLRFTAAYSATDNSLGTWLIDVILFNYRGDGLYDDYIDQESNIDSIADIGTESSFVNMQAADNVVNIFTESIVTTEYELEQEIQFTNVLLGIPKVTLAIKTGTMGSEDLKVQYRDGSSWIVISSDLTSNSWNNLTITDYLSSSTFTIRFVDGNKILDSSSDTWEIDTVVLNYDSKEIHYELDWEHQVQGLDTTKEFYNVTIYGYSSDSTEDFQVQLWNQSSSTWTTPFSLTITNSQQWYNYSIPSSGLIGSTITWRYTGTKDGPDNLYDLVQNILHIDYAGIASYEELPTVQSNPADLEYTEGSTGNTVQWTIIDSNATTYVIYLDDVPGAPTAWTSGVPIIYNVDGLAKGVHNVTIFASDISDNIISDYVQITVTDEIPPVISSPGDFTYEAGATSNTITWVATDFNAGTYEIWNSTNIIKSATSWTSGVPVIYNVDGFLKGIYNFTIIFSDTSGNFANDTVFVTVEDTTNPIVIGPSDIIFEIGQVGNQIDWSLSDLDPGTYTIYEDGSPVDTDVWMNGNNVTYGLDSLLAGTYEYIISVADDTGNSINHTVNVVVNDFTAPVLDTPADFPFAEGSLGNIVVWTATDLDPGIYIIYENGTQINTSVWISGVGINYNLDSLLKGTYNYTIIVYDRSGNTDVHTVIITVTDETPPTVTSPIDFQYFEGTTGANINITWHTIDNYPVQLSIYRDGTKLYSVGWTNDTDTVVIVDRLAAGVYNFTIQITDESGFIATDTVWVTVVDNTPPVVDHPVDITYTVGFTGNTIEWIATDIHPDYYTVSNDSQQLGSAPWVSGETISVNIDGLSPGVHNYTIVFFDLQGNQVNDTVTINVTEESVFTVVPDDVFYIEGATGNYLNWTVEDTNPANYIIYQNGSIVNSGTWTSGVQISWSIDGLAIEVYNFTIWIDDLDGNEVTDLVWVTVSDLPVWNLPEDRSLAYYEGTTGNNVDWNASDMFPDYYEIYNDTGLVASGSWTSGVNITLNLDGLPKGIYNYTIYIYDTVGNSISDTFAVTVNDNTPPTMSTSPLDIQYDEGELSNNVLWNATENYPDYYIIQNDTGHIVQTDVWISGNNIVFNVDGLSKGVFNFTITLFDQSGNFINDTIQVVILDGSNPVIISPIPNPVVTGYSEDQTGNTLTWTATDNYADIYEIWNSTHLLNSSNWESGVPIVYAIDGFTKGTHNFTIIFIDISRNNASHIVLVTVTDDTDPIFDYTPSNLVYSEGAVGNQLNWSATDSYSGAYDIYNDTGLFASGSWTSGVNVTIDFDSITKGLHNYTITFYDASGNFVTHMITVTVNDNTNPVFSYTPANYQYSQGTSGHHIEWTASDNYEANYVINGDSGTVKSGIWVTGFNITLTTEINGLSKGVYNYTITIYDVSGNFVSHLVRVTVIDTTLPIITTTAIDPIYAEGDIGNTLLWEATDLYANNYEIWNETNLLVNTTWTSGVPIIYGINGLVKGDYNFTIVFVDGSNNKISNTILFTVTDETLPVIDSPANINYQEGNVSQIITWTVSDKYADYYEIFNGSNPTPIKSGVWTSGTIFVDVSGSILGDYTYTLYINDTSGNIASDAVLVRVVEYASPTFTFEPNNVQYNEVTVSGKTLNWTATDTYNESYVIYRNEVFYQGGFWNNLENITLNLDGLKRGVYNFTIVVSDSSDNYVVSMVEVTILDETPPVMTLSPGSSKTYESGTTGNKIEWRFSDSFPSVYEIYHNGSVLGPSKLWQTGKDIQLGIDFDQRFGSVRLAVGFHNFTIVVHDQSGNLFVHTVIVEVTDTISPAFTIIPISTYDYTETPNSESLIFTLIEINPSNYVILKNGSLDFASAWSGGGILFTALEYNKGVWNYTILVYDQSGHYVSHTTIVTVSDIINPIFAISPVNEFTLFEGDPVNDLRWRMIDKHPDSYVLYMNDAIVLSGNWLNNEPILRLITGLSTGIYNYTLYVNDTSSNFLISTIIITVEDHTLPEFISQPTISNYTEGTTGHDLIWNVFEIHPLYYNITIDSVLLINTTYTNMVDIVWNIDGLEAGFYNYTIFVFDESRNHINQTFIIEVIDDTIPILTSMPEDHTINATTVDNFLIWEATDTHASIWILYVDDDIIKQGSWISGVPIKINIDGFDPGFYDFRIEIEDESHNTMIDEVTIRVKDPNITDTTHPIIVIEKIVFEGDKEEFHGTWLTTPAEGNNGVVGGTVSVKLFLRNALVPGKSIEYPTRIDGNYTIIFDYSGLRPENYTWKISFTKDGYQEWLNEIKFKVLPHTYGLNIIIEDSIEAGREFTIAVALRYENNGSTTSILYLNEYIPVSKISGRLVPVGIPVVINIVLVKADGTEIIIIKTINTNNNGIALFQLSAQETNSLVEIKSIKAEVLGTDNYNGTEFLFDSARLPRVTPSDPGTLAIIFDFISENAIIIPVILISLVALAIIGLKFNSRRTEIIRQINSAVKSAHSELQAIKSIEAIIIQTPTKLTIYEEQVAQTNVNSTIIGGMVTAFSSFLDEIGKSELFGFEMMEREGLSLTLHQGKISNIIIISTDKLPIVLLSQIKSAQEEIESAFKSNFTNTARGVTRLTLKDIHPKFHAAEFKLDLVDELIFNNKNIKKMLRQRSLSRALKHNIRMLYDFPKSAYYGDETFKLNDIIEFFQSKGITERVASRTIMLAYQFDVIDSIQFDSRAIE